MSVIVTARLNKSSREIGSAKRRDPDLWVIEIESEQADSLLDTPILP